MVIEDQGTTDVPAPMENLLHLSFDSAKLCQFIKKFIQGEQYAIGFLNEETSTYEFYHGEMKVHELFALRSYIDMELLLATMSAGSIEEDVQE